uniref:(northern house mosquito) hypothetical protein n=1 Tax=Culex pipiens TaxID=7175 RepID=A0A8D8C2G9_CULPI
MEGDPSLQQNIVIRRRSSLFRSNSSPAIHSPSNYKPSYEKQLMREIEDWNKLMRRKIHEINQHAQASIELDTSLLTEEQHAYLAAGPKVDAYVAASNDFTQLLERYVERKSFLTQRYQSILNEARSQMSTQALDLVEKNMLSQKIE